MIPDKQPQQIAEEAETISRATWAGLNNVDAGNSDLETLRSNARMQPTPADLAIQSAEIYDED